MALWLSLWYRKISINRYWFSIQYFDWELGDGLEESGYLRILKYFHDDAIKWKHFPRYWPFVRGIHRSPVNSPHKGQWRGTLMLSLICARINCWVNNREAGDLRRNRAHNFQGYCSAHVITQGPVKLWRVTFLFTCPHDNCRVPQCNVQSIVPYQQNVNTATHEIVVWRSTYSRFYAVCKKWNNLCTVVANP